MNKLSFNLILLFSVCISTIFTDISGKWTGNLNIPTAGTMPITFNFKVNGNELSGFQEIPGGNYPITKGVIDGSNITFVVDVRGNEVPHQAKVYADSIIVNFQARNQSFKVKLTKLKL